MTDDRAFARTLRERADAAVPAMSVDVEAVVRTGRRRRLTRAGAVLALCLVGTAGAWTGVQALDRGAAQEPAGVPGPDVTVAPEDLHAEVDPVAGTITLPLDRYALTEQEQATVTRARAWAMKTCAETAVGRTVEWQQGTPGEAHSDRRFGVWDLAEAERYGYGLPPEGGTSGGAVDPGIGIEVWDACNASETVRALSPEADASYELAAALRAAGEQAVGSEAARSAVADWTACLAEHGLAPVDRVGEYMVAGASTGTDAASVAAAVTDVGCKTSVDLVARLADAEATAAAPVLAAFRAELEQRSVVAHAALARAERYLAEHPEIP